MVKKIISGLLAAGVSVMAWPVMVRQSKLEIGAKGVHFPTVSGFNLDREEFEFPRDFAGELNLLFVPFLQRQQLTVNTWVPFAQTLEAAYPGVIYYELPTIDKRPMLSRTFINEGMRAGIPDQTARERTITLYIDTAQFRQATEIAGKNQVHILLVNRNGDIVWRTTGDFDEAKGAALRQAIESNRE